jgi:hypothetical protein
MRFTTRCSSFWSSLSATVATSIEGEEEPGEALAHKGGDRIDNDPRHVHAQDPVETKRRFRRKTG